MPTEDELEERLSDLLDKQQEDIDKAILGLKIENTKKGGDRD